MSFRSEPLRPMVFPDEKELICDTDLAKQLARLRPCVVGSLRGVPSVALPYLVDGWKEALKASLDRRNERAGSAVSDFLFSVEREVRREARNG